MTVNVGVCNERLGVCGGGMRRRSCRLPAGLGRAAADRSSAEPSSKQGTQSARHGGGTGKRTHRGKSEWFCRGAP